MAYPNLFLPAVGLLSLLAGMSVAADRPSDVLVDFGSEGIRIERPVDAAVKTGDTATADVVSSRKKGVEWLKKHQKMLKTKAKSSMTPANLKKFTDMITNF